MALMDTREAWLTALATRLSRTLAHDYEVPENVRLSVGFLRRAHGRGAGRVTEHYRPQDSADGSVEVFVTPALADKVAVARAVAVELCGIALRRTLTEREVAAVIQRADAIAAGMPEYPHAALRPAGAATVGGVAAATATLLVAGTADATVAQSAGPGPGSRQIKVHCAACGYTLRATRKWLAVAVPVCPADTVHGPMTVGG